MLDRDENTRIRGAQNGETEAFNPLVGKYHARLYTYIHGRVRAPELAKDLVQEVWLKAFRGIHTYRCESGFYSWVYRIAENVIKDHFRRQTHACEPLHLIDENRITLTDTCPSQDIERKELRQLLKNALECLTGP